MGSSRWRDWRASTERSLAEELIWTRQVRVWPSRAFLVAVENHFGEYLALYICFTSSHSSMVPLAMSVERGEGVFNARSRANRREAFERPTSSRASKVVGAKARMVCCGVIGKS